MNKNSWIQIPAEANLSCTLGHGQIVGWGVSFSNSKIHACKTCGITYQKMWGLPSCPELESKAAVCNTCKTICPDPYIKPDGTYLKCGHNGCMGQLVKANMPESILPTKQEAAKGLGVKCVKCGAEYSTLDWKPLKIPLFCGKAGCSGAVEPNWKDGIVPEFSDVPLVNTPKIEPELTGNKTICPVCFKKYVYLWKGNPTGLACETNCWKAAGLSQRPYLVEYIPLDTKTVIILTSFSYKNGVPAGSGKLIDVRNKVRNPWRIDALRLLNGLHPDVQKFVEKCNGAQIILNMSPLNSIRVGCMGGRHRSVAIVELLAKKFREKGFEVNVIHRDLKGFKDAEQSELG